MKMKMRMAKWKGRGPSGRFFGEMRVNVCLRVVVFSSFFLSFLCVVLCCVVLCARARMYMKERGRECVCDDVLSKEVSRHGILLLSCA